MARLTTADAARHIRYIDREESLGRLTPNLAGIREHRIAFLTRSKCCFACGRKIENKDSLKAWEVDHLGPECRQSLAVAS